jgi:hypothetical protein
MAYQQFMLYNTSDGTRRDNAQETRLAAGPAYFKGRAPLGIAAEKAFRLARKAKTSAVRWAGG